MEGPKTVTEESGPLWDAIAELEHELALERNARRELESVVRRLEDSIGGQVWDLNRSVEELRRG